MGGGLLGAQSVTHDEVVDDRQLPEVIPLGTKEHSRAGEVLGRAFCDDPQWTALVPDPDVRQVRLPKVFTGAVRMTSAARGVAERTLGFEAIALWLPPGRDIGPWAMVRSGFASAGWVMATPVRDLRRMMAVFRQFEERQKKLMLEPHWYLLAIGVEPHHEGMGFGSTLVRSGIRRADHDSKLIYLETETDRNVGFYEGLGFEVIEEMTIVEIGLAFSLMVRPPHPSRS